MADKYAIRTKIGNEVVVLSDLSGGTTQCFVLSTLKVLVGEAYMNHVLEIGEVAYKLAAIEFELLLNDVPIGPCAEAPEAYWSRGSVLSRVNFSLDVANLLRKAKLVTLEGLADKKVSELEAIGLTHAQILEVRVMLALYNLKLRD